MANWHYTFRCTNCRNTKLIDGHGYCVPIREHLDPLWLDEEARTVNCLEYRPAQISFEEREEDDDEMGED